MITKDQSGPDTSFLQAILDSLVNSVIAIDNEGTIRLFNEAASRLMDIPEEQAIGRHLLTVVPNAGLVNVLRTGESEVAKKQRIGRRVVLTNRSPIISEGKMIEAVSVFQDITEMEKISRELDSTRTIVRTLEEILAGSGEWMVVVDANGVITMMSEDYARFNGTTVAEALGKHVTEVIENTRMHIVRIRGRPRSVRSRRSEVRR